MVQLFVTLSALATDRMRSAGRDRGATAVEYGLIVALIAAVIVGVVGFLGADVLNGFNQVEDAIGGNNGGGTAPAGG